MTRPCVRSATLDGYVGLARSCDLDPGRLMSRAGLDLADVAVPDTWIPAVSVARLLGLSARESGRSDFGLRLAEVRRLTTLGPLGVVLREEPDLRSALTLLVRHEHSYNEALRLRLDVERELATVRLWLDFGEPAPTRQLTEFATAALFGVMRQLAGERWKPRAVCFAHGPPDRLDSHRRLFGPRLHFRHPFTGIVFSEFDLDIRNALADPLLQPYARRSPQSLPTSPSDAPPDDVRRVIEVLLPLGRCSAEMAARSLGITRRTLHRHLAARGETFTSVLDATRAALAERYLAGDRYSMTEISQLLGYAAPSVFSRWFREHFGTSPSE